METKAVEVVAALIFKEGRFMICQRPRHKARGLLWEFVGGKQEKGETLQQALLRECREELDVSVEVGELFMALTHVYPDMTVHLSLFLATLPVGQEPKRLEHEAIRFIGVSDIDKYEFCPADKEILDKLLTVYA